MVNFPACSNVTLFVEAMPTSRTNSPLVVSTPPYTLYAFEPGGIPKAQNIGSDPSNLTWVVDHSPGMTTIHWRCLGLDPEYGSNRCPVNVNRA